MAPSSANSSVASWYAFSTTKSLMLSPFCLAARAITAFRFGSTRMLRRLSLPEDVERRCDMVLLLLCTHCTPILSRLQEEARQGAARFRNRPFNTPLVPASHPLKIFSIAFPL